MLQNTSNTNSLSTPSPLERAGVKLKICGMKYPDNILEVGSLLPDYMGFIFWEQSARYFDGQLPDLPQSTKKTGVFVNASQEEIGSKVTQYDLQAVQLHGQESVAFCKELKEHFGNAIEIIKVFSVDSAFDFDQLKPFETVCDYFLFDTKGKLPGGNGTTFDWKILENYSSKKPFFLSGGIGLDEIDLVKQILKTDLPLFAIDLNSKFEIEPGLKNTKLLSSFKQKINF